VDIGLFPIDSIKTRLQSKILSSELNQNENKIAKNEKKVTNLYKGISSSALGSFPSGAIFFIVYDYFNNSLKKCKFV
jgi:hypothetical protein